MVVRFRVFVGSIAMTPSAVLAPVAMAVAAGAESV
jgi:hypothetical protein